MAIKIIETEEIYHQKKLSFASTLEEKAKNKLKTFFNKARKVDKSFNNDEEQTLVDEYIMLMLPIYIKAIKEQMRLLNQSRGLEELLDDELITKEAEKQAEKSAKQIVETLSKETKELNNEDKEEYYNNRDNKIEQIAINEVHTAIGISTLEMFNKNKVPYKKWVTFGDERVCQFCRPMDGVLIKSGENYWNANETMIGLEGGTLSFDYAPVSYSQLHVECRCSLVDVYEKPDKFIDYKGTNKMLEISKKIDSGFEMLKTENKKLKEESSKKEKELVDIINNL